MTVCNVKGVAYSDEYRELSPYSDRALQHISTESFWMESLRFWFTLIALVAYFLGSAGSCFQLSALH